GVRVTVDEELLRPVEFRIGARAAGLSKSGGRHSQTYPRLIASDGTELEPRTMRPGSRAFRFAVVCWVGALFFVLAAARPIIQGHGSGTTSQVTLDLLSVFWAIQFVSAAIGLIGLLWPRQQPHTPVSTLAHEMNGRLVSFRIVTRGQNLDALRWSIRSVQAEMSALPVFEYVIELATDRIVDDIDPSVVQLVTPTEYQTPGGARYKARALHYALTASAIPSDAWIFHLDEESHITTSVIMGIAEAIVEEERTGQLRVGQGAILYHRDFRRHPLLTLADTLRTGEDLGRYYLQQRIGRAVFGLHGSFILARNDVEGAVGFDLGPQGSITEDAWWALLEMDRGVRTRWIDGFVVEQSTQSAGDFVKQRRRWFLGLVRVVLHAPVAAQHRFWLALLVATWAAMPLSIFGVLFQLWTDARPPTALFYAGVASFAIFATHYCVGLQLNLQHHRVRWGWRRLCLYVGQLLLLPAFALLETAALVYAFMEPGYDFHVVRK
ncbi:MAG TPA: glycosyltransferase family 2 protein, partial [Acidothermaceae bacterium]